MSLGQPEVGGLMKYLIASACSENYSKHVNLYGVYRPHSDGYGILQNSKMGME